MIPITWLWVPTGVTVAAEVLAQSVLVALIAASASILNTVILLRVRSVQHRVRDDVSSLVTDTDKRDLQILELRSLNLERAKHVIALERISEKLMLVTDHLEQPGGRRRYDPPEEPA